MGALFSPSGAGLFGLLPRGSEAAPGARPGVLQPADGKIVAGEPSQGTLPGRKDSGTCPVPKPSWQTLSLVGRPPRPPHLLQPERRAAVGGFGNPKVLAGVGRGVSRRIRRVLPLQAGLSGDGVAGGNLPHPRRPGRSRGAPVVGERSGGESPRLRLSFLRPPADPP